MNKQAAKGSKTSKEISREIATPVPKENTQKISTKAPPRKYGVYSGLKFDFNRKTKLVVEPFSFNFLTKNEKGSASLSAEKAPQKQTNEEETKNLGDRVETSLENLENSEVLERADNEAQASGSAPDSFAVLSENEITNLCNSVDKSLDVITPQPSTSKVMKSRQPTPVKSQSVPQASNTLKLPSSTVVTPQQPSKDSKIQHTSKNVMVQAVKCAKNQTSTTLTDAKVSQKKYSAHTGLKINLHADGKKGTIARPFNFENRAVVSRNKNTPSDKQIQKAKPKEYP